MAQAAEPASEPAEPEIRNALEKVALRAIADWRTHHCGRGGLLTSTSVARSVKSATNEEIFAIVAGCVAEMGWSLDAYFTTLYELYESESSLPRLRDPAPPTPKGFRGNQRAGRLPRQE